MPVLLITTDTEGFIIHQKFENEHELMNKLDEDYNVEACKEAGYNPQPHMVTSTLTTYRFDTKGYRYF